jgi:hypothetical protein
VSGSPLEKYIYFQWKEEEQSMCKNVEYFVTVQNRGGITNFLKTTDFGSWILASCGILVAQSCKRCHTLLNFSIPERLTRKCFQEMLWGGPF